MHIRKAVVGDMKAVHKILNHYADQGFLLPRPLSELYDHVRDYVVLHDEVRHRVNGVCGLGICWDDLAEIKALAVVEETRNRGFGARLVQSCLEEARVLGLIQVFTLTYIPRFFEKLGFEEVEKSRLPHKIWADCLKCPKFPDCDETALMLEL
jgi:amino-acid N-acetyltransferase